MSIQEIENFKRQGDVVESQECVRWDGKSYCILTQSVKCSMIERIGFLFQSIFSGILGDFQSAQKFFFQAFSGKKIGDYCYLSKTAFGHLLDDIHLIIAGQLNLKDLVNG